MKHLKQSSLVLLLTGLLILAGCGFQTASSLAASSASTPTSLHVTRTNRNFPIPPLDKTVMKATQVQQLYTVAHALPVPPSGIYVCPDIHDTGTLYHLEFFHDGVLLEQMTLDTSGCRDLLLGKTDGRHMDDAFLSLFLNTVGIPALNPPPT